MADRRPVQTIPILPCPDLDEALAFYGALGFSTAFRQVRPNPYAVVRREGWELHLAAIDGFDPEQSYASAIVVVPDAEELYAEFAAGLRAARGRVPLKGIPRLLRPRRKQGTVSGFTLVDVGGNWLRIYRAGAVEGEDDEGKVGLARVLLGAARQGDAHGDEGRAATLLEKGLQRHPDAPASERVEALVYLAELRIRLGEDGRARDLLAQVARMPLTDDERDRAAASLAVADELSERVALEP